MNLDSVQAQQCFQNNPTYLGVSSNAEHYATFIAAIFDLDKNNACHNVV